MEQENKKPLLVFQKKVENTTSRMIIPKVFTNKHGMYYRMEVYEDKIILIPNKKEN